MVNKLFMDDCLEKFEFIYRHMADAESKEIFTKRLLYSATGDIKYIREIIQNMLEGKEFISNISGNHDNYIFGAGIWGQEFANTWSGYWQGFLDNNPQLKGKKICGLPVLEPSQILNEKFSGKIFICTRLYYQEIREQLISLGISDDIIFDVGHILDTLAARQYFDLKELPHSDKEVFVDVGSLDGKTAINFSDWSGDFSHIYCLEPDVHNLEKCRKNLSLFLKKGKASIIAKGAWSNSGMLNFMTQGDGGSTISTSDTSDSRVQVIALDDEFADKKVTFIKMDIEGSEAEAIQGAKHILSEQKPKLAISMYHKKEDVLILPNLILDCNPSYQFYIRHYSIITAETVLYAI